MNTLIGMVVRTDGPQVTVRDPEGGEWRCVLRGRLRQALAGTTNPVAVGDRVEVDVSGPRRGGEEGAPQAGTARPPGAA